MALTKNELEMLVRIDQKLLELKDGESGDIPEIKRHLEKLNNQVHKNSTRVAVNRSSLVRLWLVSAGVGTIIIGILIKIMFELG